MTDAEQPERQRQDQARASLSLVEEEGFLWLVNGGEAALEPGEVILVCGEQRLERARPDLAPGERVAMLVDGVEEPGACTVGLPE